MGFNSGFKGLNLRDILDINDVSGVLNFRRQVIGRRQSDIFIEILRLSKR